MKKKNLECEVSDDNKIPLSKIILKKRKKRSNLLRKSKLTNYFHYDIFFHLQRSCIFFEEKLSAFLIMSISKNFKSIANNFIKSVKRSAPTPAPLIEDQR